MVVIVSCPSGEPASRIAKALVEEGIAACVTIVQGVQSIYRWEGKVEEADEQLLLIKTAASLYERVEEAVLALHPYRVPEIISITVSHGYEKYLSWMDENVSEAGSSGFAG